MEIREASADDLAAIRRIYNEGIEDRAATLDTDPKSRDDILEWWNEHADPYGIFIAVELGRVIGWASLNRFSHRCAHAGIADLSIYVARDRRGRGVGTLLLRDLIRRAQTSGFSKIVLHALDENEQGKRLYEKLGFREVGVFRQHGRLDGRLVDVVAMELLL
jgi:L-amino acid N-acyltransferase YncA